MMTKKTIYTMCGVLAIILTAVPAASLGTQPGATVVLAQAPRITTLKGVIKSIDDSAAVVVPNENKKVEITFKVTPATTRTGAVTAGNEVTVSYRFEKTERVATALTGKS